MSSALDDLLSALGPDTIAQMAGQIGASPQQTERSIQAALPLLMGAMTRNASTQQGAEALHRAAVRDHAGNDPMALLGGLLGGGGGGLGGLLGGSGGAAGGGGMGDVLGALGGLLGGGEGAAPGARNPLEDGAGILRHVLGGAQPRAAGGVARAGGIDAGSAAQLMAMLAPLIMAALGRSAQRGGLDAGGLAGVLGNDMSRLGGGNASAPGFLGNVLDADGDGDVDANDLLQRGAGLLGAFMRR
jgi:hypothetical protein